MFTLLVWVLLETSHILRLQPRLLCPGTLFSQKATGIVTRPFSSKAIAIRPATPSPQDTKPPHKRGPTRRICSVRRAARHRPFRVPPRLIILSARRITLTPNLTAKDTKRTMDY